MLEYDIACEEVLLSFEKEGPYIEVHVVGVLLIRSEELKDLHGYAFWDLRPEDLQMKLKFADYLSRS